MSTTTKRKRNDSKSARRYHKKQKINEDEVKSPLLLLPDELQIAILVQVAFKEVSQLRLVCSRWNKLTRSSVFGKLTCIMEYGSNSAPLRISNLSSLCSASDADSFIIPIIVQDSKLMVDWFEYMKLRSLRESITEGWAGRMNTTFLEKITQLKDLSLHNIKETIQFYLENDIAQSTILSSRRFLVFTLKLVPHLLRYKQIDLARDFIGALLYSESEEYEGGHPSGFLRTRIYLDLFEVSTTHFPDYTLKLYNAAMKSASDAFNRASESGFSPAHYNQLLRRVLVTMIQQGATGTLEDVPSFQQHFKQPFEDCYKVIVDIIPADLSFFDTIITTCTEEFNKATDWRVQLSVVTVSQVINVEYNRGYLRSQVEFALFVLDHQNLHPEVRRAATFILVQKIQVFIFLNYATAQTSLAILCHFVDALTYLDKDERLAALCSITTLLESSFDDDEDENEHISDVTADKLNTHSIAFLMSLDNVNALTCEQVLSIHRGMKRICTKLGTRSSRYLPQYRSAFQQIVSNKTSPELWLALYFDIGCLISEFSEEAKQIIAQVERGQYTQVPIRKAMFYACCEHAQEHTTYAEDEYIEQVLSTFPQVILDGLDSPVTFQNNELIVDEAWLDILVTSDIPHEEEEGEPKPIESKPPSYVPYTEQQWIDAIDNIPNVPRQSTMKKLFNFKPPKPVKQSTADPNIIERDFNEPTIVEKAELTKMLNVPEIQIATKIIGMWIEPNKKIGCKYLQKVLHVFMAHLLLEPIKMEPLCGAMVALYQLKPYCGENLLAHYCTTILKSLTVESYEQVALRSVILSSVAGSCLNTLAKIRDVRPELLVAMVKFSLYAPISWDRDSVGPSKVCETIVKKWPRTAWFALLSGEFLREYEDLNLVQLWQIKLFGMKRIANLHGTTAQAYAKLALKSLSPIEIPIQSETLLKTMKKVKLYCELCTIDPDIGELNYFNQFLFDQHKLKNALIKANKYPGEMKYYSELLL